MYYPRSLNDIWLSASKQFPALLLTGPRQVGKTTFLQHLCEDNRTYVTLDDPATRSLANEFASMNINVNAITPGYMLTDMGAGSTEEGKEQAMKESIVKEYSDPDSVAEFIFYLAGTKGVTGQVFNLDSRII